MLQVLKWQYLWICLLLALTAFLHFEIVSNTEASLFDEHYYVSEARSIIQDHRILHPEQPPLAKLFLVTGIRVFGDNPLGWRFPSIVFGTLSILFLFLICKKLGISIYASMLAAFLFAFENLSFVQSSIAMLDVFFVAFMLAAFLLYLRGRQLLVGVCIGLSALAKLTGGLALAVIFLYWLIAERRYLWHLLIIGLSTIIAFIFLLLVFDYMITLQITSPFEHLTYMLGFARTLTFSGGFVEFASYPWDWLLDYKAILYSHNPQYIAVISPTICLMVIPVFIFMLLRYKSQRQGFFFGIAWFAGTYLFWIPLGLLTDRVSYIYYFYPAVGAICLGLGAGITHLWTLNKRILKYGAVILASVFLALHVMLFILFFPGFEPIIKWFPSEVKIANSTLVFKGLANFTAQVYLGKGDEETRQGNLQQAIEEYNKAITQDSVLTSAYSHRGRAYSRIGNYQQAIIDCNKAVVLSPFEAPLYDDRAQVYLDMRQWDSAIADSNNSIELDPYFASAFNTRGIAYGSKMEYEKAIMNFTRSVEIDPYNSDAYFNRGLSYKTINDKSKAIADLEKFITLAKETEQKKVAQRYIEEMIK